MAFEPLFTVADAAIFDLREEAQMGQAGMGREQQENLLLHHYILSTTLICNQFW